VKADAGAVAVPEDHAAVGEQDDAVETDGAGRTRPVVTYISWAQSCSRSDHMARELGGRSHMVYLPKFGSRASTIVFKYIGQWVKTARILRRERPEVVFVMTPPLFAALPAFWYARRHHKPVVLDAHSAAFLHPRWRRWLWLQRALCRRAVTTLVHGEAIATLVREGGGHATLVPDVPITFPDLVPFPRPGGFVVAVVCSFNYDEPLAAIVDAARLMPDVSFFMTGNPKHFPAETLGELPRNLTLTGFISTATYGGLLATADVVMTLTTRDHTMLRGAYEAIYQGTPVIVSNWTLLRDAFPEGAAHVDNSPEDIVRAIKQVRRDPGVFRAGASRLRQVKLSRWEGVREQIVARLSLSRRSHPPITRQ
jgi:glycosyltransferase involved in cell wall biosynthesis